MERKDFESMLQPLKEDIKIIRDVVAGNGDPSKGLIVRVDRLEQSSKQSKWWFRSIAITLIGFVVALAKALFS